MNTQHIILLIAWIIYCVLHSILAAGSVKRKLQHSIGTAFRYYRFAYTIFAFVGLAAILLYQVSIDSPLLFNGGLVAQIIGAAFAALGASMMMLNIIKYFIQLSGIKWLLKTSVEAKLERGGLHGYVRHPLYLGTFVFIWALWVVYPYWSLLIADVVITAYTLFALRYEEQKLLVEFGEEYRTYQQEVPMILPRLKKASNRQ